MKRVVISSVITLLIILLVAGGYFYYRKSSFFRSDPLAAVPPDAAFILSSQHAGRMFQQLFKNDAWKTLGHSADGSTVQFFDSLLRKAHKGWEEQPVVLSVHVTRAGSFDCLFLLNTSSGISESAVTRGIEEVIRQSVRTRRYENVSIKEATIGNRNFAFAVSEGILLCSFTSFLVEDAIRQLKTGNSVHRNLAFKNSESQTEGRETVCYINYNGLGTLAANLGTASAESVARSLVSFAGWSALETNIQSHSLLLSGFTTPADTTQLSALFASQLPVTGKLNEIVPARTAFLMAMGFSNADRFFQAASVNPSFNDDTAARRKALDKISLQVKSNVQQKMTQWAGSHLALVVTEAGNANFSNNTYLCLEVARTEDARRRLDAFRKDVNKMTGVADPQETYRNHTISFLNIPDVASLVYGKSFSRLGKFYYTFIRNYLVAGNTASALRSFIDDYEDGKTLASSATGKDAFAPLSNEFNLLVYMNQPAMQNILRSYGLAGEKVKTGSVLQAFTTFTFTLSSQRNGLQSAMLWNRTTNASPGIRLTASARLDTSIVMLPCLFPMGEEGRYGIAVQDAARTLYLLDETGEVLWKKQLTENILGEIHPVDFFRNGSVQLLFNTASALYLVDMEGAYTGNYPIRLPSQALAGVTVLPADARGQERIFVSCRNGQVYAYEISGKPLATWIYNGQFTGNENPLLPFTAGGKNFLVQYNSAGEVHFLDESGTETSLFAAKPFEGLTGRLKIFHNDSTKQSVLAGRDAAGRIVVLSGDGKATTLTIPGDSAVYDFSLWAGPGNAWYPVVAGAGGIRAFNDAGEQRFSIPLACTTAAFLQDGNGTVPHCILVSGTGKIYLFDNTGQLAAGFPVKGTTAVGLLAPLNVSANTWAAGDADGSLYLYEIH